MRIAEIRSPAFPTRTFRRLYHVGSMDASQKREGSLEGHGLSVSTHPDAWRQIARGTVYGDLWQCERPGNRFLHYHRLGPRHKQVIAAWAVEQGYAVPGTVYRMWVTDEEGEPRFSDYTDAAEAQAEVAYYQEDEGLATRLEEIPGAIHGTPRLAQRAMQPRLDTGMIQELATIVYVEEATNLDGVWWQDDYDPYALSAPRGVIVPKMLKGWSITKMPQEYLGDEF